MFTHVSRVPDPFRRIVRTLLAGLRRVASGIAELNRLQERLSVRRLSYDIHLACPDAPPETYREFLVRTRGPLRREPSARARLDGRCVR